MARQLKLSPGSSFEVTHAGRKINLDVAGILSTGGAEDNQVYVNLPVAQGIAGVGDGVGLVEISVSGNAERVQNFVTQLAARVPELEVRPLRQIAQAEGQLLSRLRMLLLVTVALVLALTGLCVLATMATLAMERRSDIGLMKALGGAMPRLVRMFLAEVGLLGAVGGALGSLLGAVLAAWIGRRVFGTIAARCTISCSRSSASARFISWLRCCCALITTTPSRVMRWSLRCSSRAFTAPGRDEPAMSKRRWIALETLFTFCPPAPAERTAESSISLSGIMNFMVRHPRLH